MFKVKIMIIRLKVKTKIWTRILGLKVNREDNLLSRQIHESGESSRL